MKLDSQASKAQADKGSMAANMRKLLNLSDPAAEKSSEDKPSLSANMRQLLARDGDR
ncbi:hypothetical protein IGS74_18865 [Aureimonas sp. OT7]|uniref:hypothetical protein n=1 Tax=Aureimonas sp. OT7 TaxID=2816454 RepID=UPI001786CE4F|nr:hypothetical protein [Aureimonas sp. OT7]QOG06544.1 hypothetical protein IGS74_18865 [Aureimonas sp. OT7]